MLCLTLGIPWSVACQAPLSMGFSRQEHWSGLPFPSPEDLPDPGIEPASPELQADSLPLSHQENPRALAVADIPFFSFFLFFFVLPVYCYRPISLHPCAHTLSHVTPWTAARQAPLSMDFSRQEYWSGLPFPSLPSYSFFPSICLEELP